MLHQVNLTNFSLDLISGLPHQTLEMWSASLQRAIDLTPPHLSIYDLTVEPGTTFDRWYTPGCSPLPTDEMTAQFYRLTQQTLTQAGYRHYEISNYARLGYECRHNCVYWNNQSYYGFGMGAASYVNGQRFTRPRKRGDYFQWVEAGQPLDCAIAASADVWLDTLMVGLRLAQGLSLAQLTNQFGAQQVKKLLHCLEPYQQKGWLQIDEAEQKLRLTDPEGFLFSNIVLATVFECFETGEVGKE
jgi:oxygen-independent coproporphyrinogen-3 oxidase